MSNHAPILLTASTNVPRPVVFRFNNHWIHHHEFNSIVQSAWESVATSQPSLSQSAKLCLCLKRSRADLKAWSKQLRQPDQVLANCNLVVGMMDALEEQRPLSHAEFTLRTLVRESAARQSTMIAAYWRERGKVKRCCLSDENTAYHHMCATVHMRNNKIKAFEVDGQVISDHPGKAELLLNFYRNLLGQDVETTTIPGLETLFSDSRLDTFQAEQLVQPFTAQELRRAVFDMRIDSAPGPDGFGPRFFRAQWDLVKDDLLCLLNDFHSGTIDLRWFNMAFIVLLPKKKFATHPKDYRPISLQNCSTKICTKSMTTRLQQFIEVLVHADQTGFIKGRSISETFVYAAENCAVLSQEESACCGPQIRFPEGF